MRRIAPLLRSLAQPVIVAATFACSSADRDDRLPAGDPCDAIDLRAPGGALAGIPSGEQGDGYTCGFYAVSALVDGYRQGVLGEEISPNGPRLATNPLALAVDLAVERNRPIWFPLQLTSDPLTVVPGRHGSLTCDIFRHVRKNGVCRNPDPVVYGRAAMTDESNRLHRIYDILYRYGRASKRKRDLEATVVEVRALLGAAAPPADVVRETIRENRRRPYRAIRALVYPHCDRERITAEEMDFPRCRTKLFVGLDAFGLGGKEKDAGRGPRANRWLNRLLERPDALPVVATHCYGVFREGRAFAGRALVSPRCILHHVAVIGRRSRGGKCQYLVRNSYDPKDEYAVSADWERDGGDFWIDAEPFERSLFSLQFLDAKDLSRAREEIAEEDAAEARLAEWERELGWK